MTIPHSTTDDDSAAENGNAASLNAPQRRQGDGSVSWSQQLTNRFGIEFNDDLCHWWDELCMLGPGSNQPGAQDLHWGEFRYAATPQTLLSMVPDPIWPPLMPPNFLPLVGNGAGDWLCLRLIDPDVAAQTGITTDICQWYHGGGDWLPWGTRLAEAFLFDWSLAKLPQSDRRHAEPAQDDSSETVLGVAPTPQPLDWESHAWSRWVAECLPAVHAIDWKSADDPQRLASEMLQHRLCETPVRCQLVIDALSSELAGHLAPKIAHDLGMAWNDLMRWSFDLRTMPPEIAERLQQALQMPAHAYDPAQQRWDEVANHATKICQSNVDLSWGHDLLGYVRWSAGDMQAAEAAFSRALRCSVFTDQSVRLRTHWATSSDGVAKFSARFLEQITSSADSNSASGNGHEDRLPDQIGRLPNAIERDRLLSYFGRCTADGASSVRKEYSQMLIDEAAQSSSPATSARLLYAAGWDLGAEPLRRYGELLDRYIQACQDAGWSGHERLAGVHRDGLKARYNL
ncbi:SMI1/KNR4 family protein [Aporhodopirellula aestuarii]|uniref:SMI1/KNR4 family protein n=1 Tax=Aporhodopirellula aestuarii TaxID=2950107 RepID=A0ABT0U671_9BACT|nr:SMI1/KNR4 family protein [Aporhodopirellula aestuarii]MCM2372425.1 SMI1/KNR4 family protein [Aporhodopirellula aestuarii]